MNRTKNINCSYDLSWRVENYRNLLKITKNLPGLLQIEYTTISTEITKTEKKCMNISDLIQALLKNMKIQLERICKGIFYANQLMHTFIDVAYYYLYLLSCYIKSVYCGGVSSQKSWEV